VVCVVQPDCSARLIITGRTVSRFHSLLGDEQGEHFFAMYSTTRTSTVSFGVAPAAGQRLAGVHVAPECMLEGINVSERAWHHCGKVDGGN